MEKIINEIIEDSLIQNSEESNEKYTKGPMWHQLSKEYKTESAIKFSIGDRIKFIESNCSYKGIIKEFIDEESLLVEVEEFVNGHHQKRIRIIDSSLNKVGLIREEPEEYYMETDDDDETKAQRSETSVCDLNLQ